MLGTFASSNFTFRFTRPVTAKAADVIEVVLMVLVMSPYSPAMY